jgi:SAM-dependent methyltransferase
MNPAASIATESQWMQWCRRLGWERLAWALRRVHTPVSKQALVLEVGSGGNPYPRANVLLDAYEETSERHWVPLTVDRPFVLGFVENLPFRDKAFDFVIASHVLEHSKDPARFLSELMRVAKAGYIEVPDAFMERVNPYEDHRLEISSSEKGLRIRKKTSWKPDADTVALYETRAKRWIAGETIPKHPFDFHVRYYWQDTIAFEVINPNDDAAWKESKRTNGWRPAPRSILSRIKGFALSLFRRLLSQNRRNREIDLTALLQCIRCSKGSLSKQSSGAQVQCTACAAEYPVRNGIPMMH